MFRVCVYSFQMDEVVKEDKKKTHPDPCIACHVSLRLRLTLFEKAAVVFITNLRSYNYIVRKIFDINVLPINR